MAWINSSALFRASVSRSGTCVPLVPKALLAPGCSGLLVSSKTVMHRPSASSRCDIKQPHVAMFWAAGASWTRHIQAGSWKLMSNVGKMLGLARRGAELATSRLYEFPLIQIRCHNYLATGLQGQGGMSLPQDHILESAPLPLVDQRLAS